MTLVNIINHFIVIEICILSKGNTRWLPFWRIFFFPNILNVKTSGSFPIWHLLKRQFPGCSIQPHVLATYGTILYHISWIWKFTVTLHRTTITNPASFQGIVLPAISRHLRLRIPFILGLSSVHHWPCWQHLFFCNTSTLKYPSILRRPSSKNCFFWQNRWC